MAAEKTEAIVLRVVDFSETSCIVTLFTRDFGKISGLAKGGRRPKGPFESALDLLSRCQIVFLRKSSDALDLLTEAKLLQRFRGKPGDLQSIYAGIYAAELLTRLTDEYDPHPELFDAIRQTLAELTEQGARPRTLLYFELALLRLLGHQPTFSDCSECGATLKDAAKGQGTIPFGLTNGGVLCDACRPGKPHVVRIKRQTLEVLTACCEPSSDHALAGDSVPETIDRQVHAEIRRVVNGYLMHLMGSKTKSLQYVPVLAASG